MARARVKRKGVMRGKPRPRKMRKGSTPPEEHFRDRKKLKTDK